MKRLGARSAAVFAGLCLGSTALAAPDGVSPETRDRLRALGYAETVGTTDPYDGRSGVTIHDSGRAAQGVNVYCSEARDEVFFVDMDGNTLRTLPLPHRGLPGNECLPVLYGERDLLVLNAPALMRLGADGAVRWLRVGQFHHDVAVGPKGEIYAWESRAKSLVHRDQEIEIANHVLSVLTPDGDPTREIDLYDLFGDRIPETRLTLIARRTRRVEKVGRDLLQKTMDVFHPNSVEYVESPPSGMEDADLLISIRNLDLIALVDSERKAVVWSWGKGILERQHQPTLLQNGNILVFDNGMWRRWSRVIEVDPRREEIVWEYRAPDFFSAGRSGAELLPGGNRLITESGRGRVFEITGDGDVVWEFLNPIFDGSSGERTTVYRMLRISPRRWRAFAKD